MRTLWCRWWCLVLLGTLVACGTDDDPDSSQDQDVSGGDDIAPEDTDEPGDTAPDVQEEPDVPDLPDTSDPSDPGDPEEVDANACGGLDPLTFEGEPADVGDACGVCQDGALACDGDNALQCLGGSALNACGGCGFLAQTPGDSCGPCGSSWQCDGDAGLTCDRVEPNACGGCAPLADTPGTACSDGDDDGIWVCDTGDEALRCDLEASNACGGQDILDPLPGTTCGPCDDGVVRCDGIDATRCDGATEENACGGCGSLQGEPDTACGQNGTWVCEEGRVTCDEPEPNACGGTDALRGAPGEACAWGATWRCEGENAVACRVPESWREARGEAVESVSGAEMEVELELEGLDAPVRVRLPAGSWRLPEAAAAEVSISVRDWDSLDAALEHVSPEAPAILVEIRDAVLLQPARLTVPLQDPPALAMRVEPGAYSVDPDDEAFPQPMVTRPGENSVDVLIPASEETTVLVGTTARETCEGVVCEDPFVEEACTATGVRLESAPLCIEDEGCVVPHLEYACSMASSGTPHCFEGECYEPNACDGRAQLEGEPGASCGACGSGVWACDGTEALRCDGDQGEGALNACGGCATLPEGFEVGGLCETCGTWTCGDEGESGSCVVPAEGCPETCEELACEDRGRACIEADVQAGEAERCGECLEGHAADDEEDPEATCWLQAGDRGLGEPCTFAGQCGSGVCGKRPEYFEYFVRGMEPPDGTFVGSSEGGFFTENIEFLVRFMFSVTRECLEPCLEEGSVCSRGRVCQPTPEWMDIGGAEVGNRSFYGLAGDPGEPARALCVEPGVCDLENGFFIDRDGDTFGGDTPYEPVAPLHCPPSLSMALQWEEGVHRDGLDPDEIPQWEGGEYWWVATRDGDCDDTERTVYPGAPNRCDGMDTSCTGDAPDTGADEVCAALADSAACIDAVCQLTNCDPDRGDCDGNVFNGCESNLLENRQHCGGCGIACADNEYCEEGVCIACDEGELWCPSRFEAGVEACTDTQDTRIDCGGCGVTCAFDEVCSEGACQLCPSGQVRCGTTCVDDNGCGGCAELAEAPGDACEVCGVESTLACEGENNVVCDVTADQCLAAPLAIGAPCTHPAECGDEAWCPPRANITNRAWPEFDRRCTPHGQTFVPPTAPQSTLLGPREGELGSFQPPEVPYVAVTTAGFFMDQHEVTQGEWSTLAGDNPSRYSACGDSCPIDSVSWWSALWFANLRSIEEGFTPCYLLPDTCEGSGADGTLDCGSGWPLVADPAADGNVLRCEGYRLPTDTEWEVAVRQGLGVAALGGDLILPVHVCLPQPGVDPWSWHCGNAVANYDGCENRSGVGSSSIYGFIRGLPCTGPQPVGTRRPNEIGLYDMLGNVDEWVWDSSTRALDTESLNIDPVHQTTGVRRILRGGAWLSPPRDVRMSSIDSMRPEQRSFAVGFRLVRNAPVTPFLGDCDEDAECVTGYCGTEGRCIGRPQTCERLGCAREFKACTEADGDTGAQCGDCLQGWLADDEGVCQPEQPTLEEGAACSRAGECITGICGPTMEDLENISRGFLLWLSNQEGVEGPEITSTLFFLNLPRLYEDDPITDMTCLAPCESDAACGEGHRCADLERLAEIGVTRVAHPDSPAGAELPTEGSVSICVSDAVCDPGQPRYRDGDLDGFGAGAPYEGEIPDLCPPTIAMVTAWAQDLTDDGFPGFAPEGWALTPLDGDCDDTDANVYPGAPNRCDGKDTQCVGEVDSEDVCAVPDRCDELTEAVETGDLCTVNSDCAEGAICVEGIRGAQARCMQSCLLNACTAFCGVDDVCAVTERSTQDPEEGPSTMTFPGLPVSDDEGEIEDITGICFAGGTCDDLVPPSVTVGGSCTPGDEFSCDRGSVCLDRGDGAGHQCQRTCAPGICEASCGEEGECMPLLAPDGTPWELAPLVRGGYCREAIPPAATHQGCGTPTTGSCEAGNLCVSYTQDVGTCAQLCPSGGECVGAEGFDASCSLSAGGESICAIVCEDFFNSSDCPSFMQCVELGPGFGACGFSLSVPF